MYVKSSHFITLIRVTAYLFWRIKKLACHVTKININKQPTKQNVIVLFNKNLKAFVTNDSYLYNYAHLR